MKAEIVAPQPHFFLRPDQPGRPRGSVVWTQNRCTLHGQSYFTHRVLLGTGRRRDRRLFRLYEFSLN